MRIYIGEKGLDKTWHNDFPKTTECHKCQGKTRIMFVGMEGEKDAENEEQICNLHQNQQDGKYWLHNCCAVAVYLCEQCGEPNTLINQETQSRL